MKKSIIIATYNGARFIEEQLDSIIAQSIQPEEVVITDDGSSDDTREIVQKYIDSHGLKDSWSLHLNEKNKGYAKNFLDGAMITAGDIVFFCDQDDIWEKNRLKKMADIMEKNPQINLLCSNLVPFYYEKDTRKWSKKELCEMKTDDSVEYCELTLKNFHLRRSGCTMCLRKKFLEEIMPYWIENWPHDDFVWKMAVASSSCAIYQFISLKRRMHSCNATVIRVRTRKWRIEQLYGFIDQYNSMLQFVANQKMDGMKKGIIERNIEAVKLRLKVVEKRQLWYWLILYFRYDDCYPRKKGVYLDLYVAVLNKYVGAN